MYTLRTHAHTHRRRSAPNIHVHKHIIQYTSRCTSARSTRTRAHVLAHTQPHGLVVKRARTHKHFDTYLSALAFSQSYWGPAAAMLAKNMTFLNLSCPNLYSNTRLLSGNHIGKYAECVRGCCLQYHKKCSTRLRKDMQADFS